LYCLDSFKRRISNVPSQLLDSRHHLFISSYANASEVFVINKYEIHRRSINEQKAVQGGVDVYSVLLLNVVLVG
jgi:hypothetical protein